MKRTHLVWVLLFLFAGISFAASSTDSEMKTNLSGHHRKFENSPLEEVKSKAERGDAEAQCELGIRCWTYHPVHNQGTAKGGAAEAAKWYRKAADQGHAEAQYQLGDCYAEGTGVAKDEVEAIKWFRKAADQGGVWAQYQLGKYYENGTGVSTDAIEAVKWYRKAAEPRDLSTNTSDFPTWAIWNQRVDAQRALAQCYSNGVGVVQDPQEAARWSLEADRSHGESDRAYLKMLKSRAETGDASYEYMVAERTADPIEALNWYRKAADHGYDFAQEKLGNCYLRGDGVPMNYIEAYKWFSLACAQAKPMAAMSKWSLTVLEHSMTPAQIAEGQRLASEFKPRKAPEPGTSVSRERIFDSSPLSSGTGFFITRDGFLVTDQHVVEGAAQVRLITSEGLVSAKVVKVDKANDLALLKAEGKFTSLPIASSRTVKLGGTVVTVGFPNVGLQGFAPKLAKGEIAALSGPMDDARYFQMSVPVQPGNSGGALVDERGNVVGLVSAKLSARAALATSGELPENVNYAMKSSFLLSFLESVPEVSPKFKEPNTKERKFEDVVTSAEQAAVLVLVY
jgi:TPR repeat protein